MIVAHVGHTSPVPATVWLAAAVVSGLLAAVAMDVPMTRLTTGWTPATVATSVLQGTVPSKVSRTEAAVLHHAVGPMAAVLYAVVGIGLAAVLPAVARIAGLEIAAHLLAAGLVTLFVYGLFAWVVLPQYGGEARDRLPAVRRDWLVSALVFGVTLAIVVPGVIAAVR
jgi:hypothetical protein